MEGGTSWRDASLFNLQAANGQRKIENVIEAAGGLWVCRVSGWFGMLYSMQHEAKPHGLPPGKNIWGTMEDWCPLVTWVVLIVGFLVSFIPSDAVTLFLLALPAPGLLLAHRGKGRVAFDLKKRTSVPNLFA